MNHDPTVSRTRVDLSGLMKVLGEHLYSTPTVALRELVQNAHDSCHRRRIEGFEPFEPRITVRTDPGKSAVIIEDNGAGLTREEIEQYLATVGAGYTRILRDQGADAGLIGYFGLGFLSAFIVAERVEVHTCSHATRHAPWLFSSRAGHSYTVREAPDRPVGTAVTLFLSERFRELSDQDTVRRLLERYCCLLEFPVFCGPGAPVNATPPPWRDPGFHSSSPVKSKRMALALAQRFEPHFAPLCYMPIEPADHPDRADHDTGVSCTGMIWIHDSATYGTSDNRNVWVFVRGMMITSEDRDLLPSWAGFAGALIESDALVPTASRESLQRNDEYDRAKEQVRDSLIRGLADMARREPEAWRLVLTRHNEALLGAALCDHRLFDLVANDLTVPTSQGDLTVPRVLALSGGTVHVSQSDDAGGFEDLLFRALKVPVVRGTRYAALPFCRMYSERVRGELIMLGTGTGDRALFTEAALPDDQRQALERWFAAGDVRVVPSRFEPTYLPLILVPDREIELKRRMESETVQRSIATAALTLARSFTDRIVDRPLARLYINVDCPAIRKLFCANDHSRELGVSLLRAFVGLTAEPHAQAKYMEVDAALSQFSATIEALLANESS